MVAGMKKRDMVKALNDAGATKIRDKGNHEVWRCSCGQHMTQVPRHNEVTPGVVRSIIKDMACHKEGWLK